MIAAEQKKFDFKSLASVVWLILEDEHGFEHEVRDFLYVL